MSSRRVQILHHLDVTSAAAADHAAPTDATGGLSLATWKQGGYSPDAAIVYLDDASTAIAIAAGAYVAGYDANRAAWFRVADLNGGAAIDLTATMGFAQRLIDVGGFDRLAVVDDGDTGTHKYGFKPVEALE